MSPQVFRGRNVLEAHRAALEQLGPEAIVLTTRSVARPGIRGWFGATDVEVAAALPDLGAVAPAAGPARDVPFAPGVYATAATQGARSGELAALRSELKGDIRALKALVARAGDASDLASEIVQLRDLVQEIAGGAPARDKTAAALRALGLEGPVATWLARTLKGKPATRAAVREELGRQLRSAAWPLDGGPSLVALVGPSGVGKTTTVAKLGARARADGKTVTFLACDEFRVGAVEQLARYAEWIGAELVVARTSDELRRAIDAARSDVVLVDTSGRPPTADGVEIALAPGRREPRPASRTRHVMLCVPAALRAHDALRVARRYGALSPTSLVVTKIDETDAPAGIAHATHAARLPISVVCFGHRVPEDIAPATVAALVDYVAPRAAAGEGDAPSRKAGGGPSRADEAAEGAAAA